MQYMQYMQYMHYMLVSIWLQTVLHVRHRHIEGIACIVQNTSKAASRDVSEGCGPTYDRLWPGGHHTKYCSTTVICKSQTKQRCQ